VIHEAPMREHVLSRARRTGRRFSLDLGVARASREPSSPGEARLSPYSDGETLFALEDVNYKLRDDESGEVDKMSLNRCIVGAKRYVLFNINERGETVIRKISGHGLGDLRRIETYDPAAHKLTRREHIAAPLNNLEEVRRLEAAFARGEATAEDIKAVRRRGKRKYGELAHGSNPRLMSFYTLMER
jgi:hypothetical protein